MLDVFFALRATTFLFCSPGTTVTLLVEAISSPNKARAETSPRDTSTTGKYAAFAHVPTTKHKTKDDEKYFIPFLP